MCTECASRSIIAQLNPLSSPLMRWYGKLPSQNHQKPESTAPDDWQHRLLLYGASSPCKQKYRSVWQFDILASTVQTRNPTEFLQDVLDVKGAIEGMGCDTKHVVAQVVGSCDDALEISFLWKAELHQCAYISLANVDKSWMNPMKWCKFSLSQFGTTATITASMSKSSQNCHQWQ